MARRWRRIGIGFVAVLLLAFPGRGVAYRLTAADEPELGEAVKMGKRYKYDAYLHCGITVLQLGDRGFTADEPVEDPGPWWWGFSSGYHRGTVRLTSPDRAVFTGTNGLSVRFTRIDLPANSSYFTCD